MSLRDQLQTVNKSAVANAVAWAFLIGFGFTAAEHLVGEKFDIIVILQHLANRAWLLQFLQDSFNAAAIAAIGVCRSSLFPPKTVTMVTLPPRP